MTLLIVGLGNPGKTYEKTRHNVGFFTLEILYKKLFGFHNFSEFKEEKKFKALVSKKVPNEIILAKPLTFMNNSGDAVGKIARFYKIKKQDILIIFDDIDLMIGTLRLRQEGSSGGHRGMESVIARLKTEKIARLKIGIAEKKAGKQRVSSEDYILKPASKDAEKILKKSLKQVPDIVEEWLVGETKTTISL